MKTAEKKEELTEDLFDKFMKSGVFIKFNRLLNQWHNFPTVKNEVLIKEWIEAYKDQAVAQERLDAMQFIINMLILRMKVEQKDSITLEFLESVDISKLIQSNNNE